MASLVKAAQVVILFGTSVLIGAHAQAEGMKLVTRDPERVKTCFPKVELVTPPGLEDLPRQPAR